MIPIITFQGFTESLDAPTGTDRLFWEVTSKYAGEYAGKEVTVYHPREWTANVKSLAAQMHRLRPERIIVITYSHGQSAAIDFAKHLARYNLTISLWLACDPVARPTWLPRYNWLQPLAARALTPWGKIKLPPNILRFAGVRQKISTPRGHDVEPTSSVIEYQTLSYAHTVIDEAPEWHTLVDLYLSEALS